MGVDLQGTTNLTPPNHDAYFKDINNELADKGILFVGCGVSGGEEGARHGPSMMPGGAPEAWPHVKEIFQAVAAKVVKPQRPAVAR